MRRLFIDDALQFMRRCEPETYDVIVTSPPYNRKIKYEGACIDDLTDDVYFEWINAIGQQMERILTPNGSLFLNVGSSPSDPWKAADVAKALRYTLKLQNTFVWVKSIAIEGKDGNVTSHGHFRPINSPRYVNDCFEYVFHFTKTGDVPLDRKAHLLAVPYQDASNASRWANGGDGLRCRGNTWYIPYETTQAKNRHPAAFPVLLPAMCISLHGAFVDDLRVLDPFVGSGSTMVACQELDIACDGVDTSIEYLKMAERRSDAQLMDTLEYIL